MLADTLLPRLATRVTSGTVVRSRTLRTTGVAESLLADQIESMAGGPLGVVARVSAVDRRRRSPSHRSRRAPDDADADARRRRGGSLARARRRVDLRRRRRRPRRRRARALPRSAISRSASPRAAPAGLLGARLTAIPGSSDVVLGGVIAYHNDVKRELLGVERRIAARARRGERAGRSCRWRRARAASTGARVGLAITGIAGPGGGTPEKPVGTVWIAVGHRRRRSRRDCCASWGDRDEVRQRAAQWTLELLRRSLVSAVATIEPMHPASSDDR